MTFSEFYNDEYHDINELFHYDTQSPEIEYIKRWIQSKRKKEKVDPDANRTVLDKALDYGDDDVIREVSKYNPTVTMEQLQRMSDSKDHVIHDIMDYLVRKFYKKTGDETIHQKIAKHVKNYPFADLNPRWEAANFAQRLHQRDMDPGKDDPIEEEFELVLGDD